MSHFTVLVVGDVDEQLAPFHEFECTGFEEFIKDIDETEELRKKYETETETFYKSPSGELFSQYDKKFYETVENEYGGTSRKKVIPEGYEEVVKPISERLSFEQFCMDETGYELVDTLEEVDIEGDHKYGYILQHPEIKVINRTNPNSKWDWYTVGGRWSGFFKLKNSDDRCDQCKKEEIDYDGMVENVMKEYGERYDKVFNILGKQLNIPHTWKQVVTEIMPNAELEEQKEFYNSQEDIKLWNSKGKEIREECGFFVDCEEYARSREEYLQEGRNSALSTFAILKDGVWYEKGDMGWWACVANEKNQDDWNKEFKEIWDSVKEDEYVSLVDCHI